MKNGLAINMSELKLFNEFLDLTNLLSCTIHFVIMRFERIKIFTTYINALNAARLVQRKLGSMQWC